MTIKDYLVKFFLYIINRLFRMNNKKIVISIDGNIGSGKSTFLKLLKEKYSDKFYFAKEPVDEWLNIGGENLLEKFYTNKERWSYTFQNFAYITRINELKKGLKSDKQVIITERSTHTDKNIFAKMLVDDGYMTQFELELYNTWFNNFNINIDGQIYIRTDLDKCVTRIQERNRNGESSIPREYLSSLEKNHEDWLMNHNNILILDGNQDFKTDNSIQEQYIELFDNYIQQLLNIQLKNNMKNINQNYQHELGLLN